MIDPDLEEELLANAGVFNVVLRRDEARQLVLSSPMPGPIAATYDLRDAARADADPRRADARWSRPRTEVIRVIGDAGARGRAADRGHDGDRRRCARR